MPCRDWEGWTEADSREAAVSSAYEKRVKELTDKIDKLTDKLCWIMGHLSPGDELTIHTIRQDIKTWWEEHQRQDRLRQEAEHRELAFKKKQQEEELQRKLLLASLTDEQKQLLGLR